MNQLTPQAQRSLGIAAFFCATLCFYGWWSTAPAFNANPFQDWAVFYTAATRYLELGSWQAMVAGWPLAGHPWLYPPSFLLLLWPFGFLSWGFGCVAFLLATFLAFVAALWSGAGERRVIHVLAVFLSPAAMINFYLGQNAFLSAALLGGGAMLLRRRPIVAGILFGLLAYKPQLALLVPVALIAARCWKTLASAAATGAALMLISLLIFGANAWHSWFALTAGTGGLAPAVLKGRLAGVSVFACATLLGATPILATALQALATISAAAAVYASWRSPMCDELRLSVLFAAIVLAAPHVTGYDSLLLAFAASLLFVHGLEHGFHRGEVIIALLAWAMPLITPPVVYPIGRLAPLFVALAIAAPLVRGLRFAAGASAPNARIFADDIPAVDALGKAMRRGTAEQAFASDD
ncbi:MAG TPA: glycosyltransferase family 87 protein [Stellaceae bacterium]|jgi:hypothetical protein|nr:glycosyltransferase family 87 protein [Stellaceae bacterium]